MSNLDYILVELESKINFFEITNASVSKSSVGWQIDHSLRVFNGIISLLKKSNPEEYKRKFNFARTVVFGLKYIPRGKANAPKAVRNYEEILKEDLISQIEISKKLILDLKDLQKNNCFSHPYFGILNLKQSIKFLEIHTSHHLKIINDILEQS